MKDDIAALLREKPEASEEEVKRVEQGEPLAYVLGTIPFLGLTIHLDSHPLVPRPETEWWAEELCTYIGKQPLHVLDLCAGSGAIGLSVLKHCLATRVSFGELSPEHCDLIARNIEANGLDGTRADIRAGDLFAPFDGVRFNLIATNPPYVPSGRVLDESVTKYEPHEALFSGDDGLTVTRRILTKARDHLNPTGELWMECDTTTIDQASDIALEGGASLTKIRTDQYARPRLLVAYYS